MKYIRSLLDYLFGKEVEPEPIKVRGISKTIPVIKLHTPKPKKFQKCPILHKVSRTESNARNAAKLKSNSFQKIRPYKCEFCEWWHLTHKHNKLRMH